MKPKPKKIPTRFGPETRFAVEPAVPFRGTVETELELLKARLLKQLLAESGWVELNAPLRRAANEAAALAWLTPFPLLVLPALLDEKAEAARRQAERQQAVTKRSQPMPGVAA